MSWVTIGVTVGSAAVGKHQSDKQKDKLGQLEQAEFAEEQARQRKIDDSRFLINRAFDSPARQKQYADYAAAMRQYMGGELLRQKQMASRNLKFALAKAGQIGGSQEVDQTALLGEEYSRGALKGEREVQGAVADLKGSDELARGSLLDLAERGMDLTSATRRSSSALASNLGSANLRNLNEGLGDVFKNTAQTYKTINERAAQRRGFGYRTNRNELYG